MANTAQARKRVRQNTKRRLRNMMHRTKMRTFIKRVVYAIEAGQKAEAEQAYKNATPVIDTMVTKGIIHKNKAARHKSRLSKRIKALAS